MLRSYAMLLFYALMLYSYVMLLCYALMFCSYVILLCYVLMLCSYVTLLCYEIIILIFMFLFSNIIFSYSHHHFLLTADFCYFDKGEEYLGIENRTEQGIPCLRWKTSKHSFCRNPYNLLKERPWCFTDKMGSFGYCNVQPCGMTSSFLCVFLFLPYLKFSKVFSFRENLQFMLRLIILSMLMLIFYSYYIGEVYSNFKYQKKYINYLVKVSYLVKSRFFFLFHASNNLQISYSRRWNIKIVYMECGKKNLQKVRKLECQNIVIKMFL